MEPEKLLVTTEFPENLSSRVVKLTHLEKTMPQKLFLVTTSIRMRRYKVVDHTGVRFRRLRSGCWVNSRGFHFLNFEVGETE